MFLCNLAKITTGCLVLFSEINLMSKCIYVHCFVSSCSWSRCICLANYACRLNQIWLIPYMC